MKKSLKIQAIAITMLFVSCFSLQMSAQNCIDMTALGDKNAIACFNEDLVVVQPDNYNFVYAWQTTPSDSAHPRQQLMTQQATDAYCTALNVLPPSGEPSIRLMTPTYTSTQLAQGAMVVFEITVDSLNPIVKINFAGWMENPEHVEYNLIPYFNEYNRPQIHFNINGGDKVDTLIKETPMTFYPHTHSTWTACTLQNGRKAMYRDWTSVAFDMSKYIGRRVNIYARVRDCAIENAYIDYGSLMFTPCTDRHRACVYCNIQCSPAISLEEMNCDSNYTKLSMPEGFYKYKWYFKGDKAHSLGTEHEVVLPKEHTSDTICCEVIHYAVNTPVVKEFYLPNNCDQTVCADKPALQYILPRTQGNVESYSIYFSDEALIQGFKNVFDATPSASNTLKIEVPEVKDGKYARPDVYTATVLLNMSNQKVDTFYWNFEVLYPSFVLGQDWNDVLYVKNANYNGGYDFSAIRWFKNGAETAGTGEHNGYMVNSYTFNGEDYYWAELTRVGESRAFRTCPCRPNLTEPKEIKFDIQVSSPAPGRIRMESNNATGTYTLYNIYGTEILSGNIDLTEEHNSQEMDIQCPSGTYLLQMQTTDGKSQTKKLLIY